MKKRRLWPFLLIINGVLGSLLSSSDVYIASNPILLYSNGSITDFQTSFIKAKDFKSGIIPFDNLTKPDASGLEGILYDRGYSCQLNQTTTHNTLFPFIIKTNSNKIALVRKGGGCNFYDKVWYSQLDGAVGVIIYDDIPFRDDDTSGSMKIVKGNLTITMYYVDLNVGLELLDMLTFITNNTTNNDIQPAINVILHPAVGGYPTAWEFTLIIVVALLAISFLASVGMHWHLWRIRRRQRERFQQTNRVDATTLQKRVMDTESLALFPVHVFGLSHHRESISSSRVTIQHGEQLGSEKVQQQENHDFPLVDESTCVICLDEFAAGDQIRELPCGHEYHCECIDPWLTIKSASCPLCKYDCSIYCKQPDIITSPTPPPPTLLRSTQNRSPHAFGPTISADRAEEFSRSWMARSLPRNMQRQIRDVVQQQQETVIELPARMTTPIHHHHHHTTTPSNQIIEENNTLNHRGTNRRFINLFVPKFISSRIP